MKKFNRIALLAVFAGSLAVFPSVLLAKTASIKIHVQAQGSGKDGVRALGYEVNDSRSGSLGTRANKIGPAGATYYFGVRTKEGKSVSCGSKILTKSSIVVLTFNGKTCTSSVHPYHRK